MTPDMVKKMSATTLMVQVSRAPLSDSPLLTVLIPEKATEDGEENVESDPDDAS